MLRFRSPRERRLWVAVSLAVAALLASLYPLQFVLDALRARNLLRFTIAGAFLAGGAWVALELGRRRAPWRAWLVLFLSGAIYASIALDIEVPQERLHLVEYGALALLLRSAYVESVRARPRAGSAPNIDIWTLGTATAIGWLDEAVQGILPNRQYDLRDVGFNALAAALALGTAALLRLAMVEAPGRTGRDEERAER